MTPPKKQQLAAHPPTKTREVVAILSAANFVIGMGAFMVVGLLIPLGRDLQISSTHAGWLMTTYAIGYAVLSPVLVSVSGQVGRRRILALGLGMFTLSMMICALAPGMGVLNGARVLAAAGAGLVTPVAASVAAGLAAPERRARALAGVFFGLTLAQVMGVPFGSWLAYTFGWRSAFFVVASLGVPVVWLIWTRVPAGLSFAPVTLRDLGRALGNVPLMLAVFFTSIFMGAIYVLYTYIGPLLEGRMGYGRNGVTLALLIYGIGAVIGNLAGGSASDRIGPSRLLAIVAVAQACLMPAFGLLPMGDLMLMVLCFGWAIFGWSFMSAQQVRLMALDPANAPVLLALNAAAIYVGAALGAALGGVVISQYGLGYLGAIAGLAALLSLAVLIISDRAAKANPAP